LQAGPSARMNWFSANGSGSTVPAGARGSDADAMNGNAVMYDAVAGKILTVGGAPSYQVTVAGVVATEKVWLMITTEDASAPLAVGFASCFL